MMDDRASLTAMAVAFARAAGNPVVDSLAHDLLPAPIGALGRWLSTVPPALSAPLTLGFAPHLAVRTLAIDSVLREACGDGCVQIVILGAGLDSRAHRMDEVGRLPVYEVDHPSTQRYKRARAPSASNCHYVSVNFGKQSLGTPLLAAGFRLDQPSFWIWEGVTPYLDESAVRTTLREVATLASKGSQLVTSYVTPELSRWVSGPPGSRYLNRVARGAFAVLGEPLRGAVSTDDMHERLRDASFDPVRDVGLTELAPEYGVQPFWVHATERLAIAHR